MAIRSLRLPAFGGHVRFRPTELDSFVVPPLAARQCAPKDVPSAAALRETEWDLALACDIRLGFKRERRRACPCPRATEMTTMTTMSHSTSKSPDGATWTVAEAKAKLSELIERARSMGPQTVTRNGRMAVVVVAAEEWERKTKRTGNLAEFFASSPLRGAKLEVKRPKGGLRKTEL
jgi:prevent-host-death family protein